MSKVWRRGEKMDARLGERRKEARLGEGKNGGNVRRG